MSDLKTIALYELIFLKLSWKAENFCFCQIFRTFGKLICLYGRNTTKLNCSLKFRDHIVDNYKTLCDETQIKNLISRVAGVQAYGRADMLGRYKEIAKCTDPMIFPCPSLCLLAQHGV